MSESLEQQLRRLHITFDPAVQTVPMQKADKTGDKSSGRKPSATTSHQQEDKTMNQGTQTSSIGRDVGSSEIHHQRMPTVEEHRALAEYNDAMRRAVEDIRNPLSMTNLAKTAMVAGFAVALGYAVGGVVSLFKGPDVVPSAKPGVGK